jgi:hypothetical protein
MLKSCGWLAGNIVKLYALLMTQNFIYKWGHTIAAAHLSKWSWLKAKCGPFGGIYQCSDEQFDVAHSQQKRRSFILSFLAMFPGKILFAFGAYQGGSVFQ